MPLTDTPEKLLEESGFSKFQGREFLEYMNFLVKAEPEPDIQTISISETTLTTEGENP